VNRKVIESLIQAGALDSIEGNRAQKWTVLTKTLELALSAQQSTIKNQTILFEQEDDAVRLYPELPSLQPWPDLDSLRREKEVLGFYVSGHPLHKYEDDVHAFSHPEIGNLSSILPGQSVRICGIITEYSKRFDKNSKPMVFFNLEDFTGTVRVVAFSDAIDKCGQLFEKDRMIMVQGIRSAKDFDTMSVVAMDALPMDKVRERLAKRIVLQLARKKCSSGQITRIEQTVKKYPGPCDLYFSMSLNNEKNILIKSKKLKVKPDDRLIAELRHILSMNDVWIEG